jgi:uncharacterized DUF497 family protein
MQTVAEPVLADIPDLRQAIKTLSRVSTLTSVYHIIEVWLSVLSARDMAKKERRRYGRK